MIAHARLLQMLYVKLFIVMGILWMAECLEFLLQTKPRQEGRQASFLMSPKRSLLLWLFHFLIRWVPRGHCNENPIYVFLFWEVRSLSLNFHIHVSVSVIYIPRIGPNIFLQQNKQIDCGNIENAHRHMNVEIETKAAQCARVVLFDRSI